MNYAHHNDDNVRDGIHNTCLFIYNTLAKKDKLMWYVNTYLIACMTSFSWIESRNLNITIFTKKCNAIYIYQTHSHTCK